VRVECYLVRSQPSDPDALQALVQFTIDRIESGRPACRVVGVSLALYEAADPNFPDSRDTWLVTLGTAGGPAGRREA
jgi:hypothetical protein